MTTISSSTFTQDMLSNPTLLATTIISAMESSDSTSTPISITDPNNGFVMQLFGNLCIFSNFSQKIDYINSYFYPQRARNAAQLYPHLSEFDYVQLMASPATLPFIFRMSKDWIVANAVYYNSNYNKIEIPATSAFTMGGVVYSTYYPIEILVNMTTGAVTAYYDTSVSNSLNTLASNMLLNVSEFTQNGINWFQIEFNMYQFEMTSTSYTVGSEQGFNNTLSYTDQFYAAKIFYQNSDGSYTEFEYSLSQMYYDYTTPTAILSLMTDTSQINITIPQIYFDNGQITQPSGSSTIMVQLYTSKGSVNYSVSLADVQSLTANFDTGSSSYAAPLAQMPTWLIVPTSTTVVGGSNPMTYSQIRDAVVNQSLYSRVAVTNAELIEAGAKAGFVLTKVVDDLTERIYYATNTLTDTNGNVIPTFSGNILISGNNLSGDPSTILNFSDGYYTILPTTTFTIPNNGTTCVPMSTAAVQAMAALTPTQLVAELNTGVYVRQPFHITLLTTPKSPQVGVYNLMSPSLTSLSFIAENPNSAPQMSVTSVAVVHQNNGTGGYLINLGVVRSTNIQTDNASNYQIILTCKDILGNLVYIPATYVNTVNNLDLWQVVLSTTYHIDDNDNITVSMYNTSDTLSYVDIPLNQTFTVLTSFTASYNTSIAQLSSLNALLPPSMQTSLTVMAQQTMVLSLGIDLSSSVYSGVNTTWGNATYQTAPANIYYTTNVPIFQTNQMGGIVTRLNPTTSNVEVVVMYPIGSTPSSTQDISTVTTSVTNVPSSGNTTTLAINDTTGILVGMPARGLNIPVGVVVDSIGTNSVTLSELITAAIPSGTTVTFTNTEVITPTTQAQSAPGVQLTVGSTANIRVGQSVFGFDVGVNNTGTVASVDSPTQFSLTTPTTVAVADNTLLTIVNTTAHGVIKTAQGAVLTDANGNALVLQTAQNQYSIPAILLDGRLFASTDPNDVDTVSSIVSTLQGYATQISTLDQGLLEASQVFYVPARSMGYATFGTGNGNTISLSLELSFTVNVYVTQAVNNNAPLKLQMSNSILATINTDIQNPIISVSDITDDIKTALDTNATGVEMGGINGDDSLRLIALETPGLIPSIGYNLVLNADGTISRVPNVTINFIPTPTTVVPQSL